MESPGGTVFHTDSPQYHPTCTRIPTAEGKRRDKEESRVLLRAMFPAGSTVYTVMRHVSASGMSRRITVLHADGSVVRDVSHLVARAIGWKLHDKGGIVVGGCGMDMGFHLAYTLSQALHGARGLGTREDDVVIVCPARANLTRPHQLVRQIVAPRAEPAKIARLRLRQV
jgi:hypothetical protein